MLVLRRRARVRGAVAARGGRRARRATASTTRCCSARSPAWSCWPAARTWSRCSSGLELLSIPLYVLCATELRRAHLARGRAQVPGDRLGRLGDAALRPGADLRRHRRDPLRRDRRRRSATRSARPTRCCSPASRWSPPGSPSRPRWRPFHQWTPDVYQGAPTPITTFMAVATKAAAFAILLRLFDHALGLAQLDWGPALAALATVTIVIGNVGAIAQRSLKRMLAWSGVAQAGYLLAGVVVGTELGLQATVFYLAVYLLMNVAAFAVVIARERVSEHGDDIVVAREPRPGAALAGVADDDRDAVAGRLPGHRRLHRQVLFDRRRRGRRLRLARDRDRGRLDDLARLLPARGRRDVDGPLRGRAADAPAAPRQAGLRLVARGRRARPARGRRRGDRVRGGDDLASASGPTRCSTPRAATSGHVARPGLR